ncbi:hypothetical protein WICMUC_005427 [Wickerhamomyces mucosus]|uniref:Uncharacterized protein n=1 Tax=Wickerhamomyces mucosus TaxID=1378264 RepID=A0A9P8P8C8_9ASCO|nr:hypothetical protein WICMUC_005427 [Wickerhamomyces mucosus]
MFIGKTTVPKIVILPNTSLVSLFTLVMSILICAKYIPISDLGATSHCSLHLLAKPLITSGLEPSKRNNDITRLRDSPTLFNMSPFFFHSIIFEEVDLVEFVDIDLNDRLSSNTDSRREFIFSTKSYSSSDPSESSESLSFPGCIFKIASSIELTSSSIDSIIGPKASVISSIKA